MTRTTRQMRTGSWGADYVRSIVETGWGGVFQAFDGGRDVGLDATVLDMNGGRATPYRFDLQIKTSEHFSQSATGFVAPTSAAHREWWATLQYPVFVVCVDAPKGKPTVAYWRMITAADADARTITVLRDNVFGPASRVDVLSALRRERHGALSEAPGVLLPCPLNAPLRKVAKSWYRRHLLGRHIESPHLGSVWFTWNGWRHITRRRRSTLRIQSSLLLLPAVRSALLMPMAFAGTRPLQSAVRGRFVYDARLVFLSRPVKFVNRAVAQLRIVLKQIDKRPHDWASRPPDSDECSRTYTFYSVEEVVPKRRETAGGGYRAARASD